MEVRNVFSRLPEAIPEEIIEVISGGTDVRVERILSHGHTTPEGMWYDQDETEFVMVLKGHARLLFEGDDAERELKPGDYLTIPPHIRHRVTWTTPEQETLWLAVFY